MNCAYPLVVEPDDTLIVIASFYDSAIRHIVKSHVTTGETRPSAAMEKIAGTAPVADQVMRYPDTTTASLDGWASRSR